MDDKDLKMDNQELDSDLGFDFEESDIEHEDSRNYPADTAGSVGGFEDEGFNEELTQEPAMDTPEQDDTQYDTQYEAPYDAQHDAQYNASPDAQYADEAYSNEQYDAPPDTDEAYPDEQYSDDNSIQYNDEPNKKVKQKKVKEAKQKKVKEEQPVEEEVKPDLALYIIADNTRNMLGYLRSCGLNVSNVFDSIESLRGILLMETMPSRVVVIDSGTGKFVTPTIRRDLIDLIGVNDEDTKFTVFYTDSVIKSDAIKDLGKTGKNIEWVKYESTVITAATLLSHHENYVFSEYPADIAEVRSLILSIKPADSRVELERLNGLIIKPEAVLKAITDTSLRMIPGFKLRI